MRTCPEVSPSHVQFESMSINHIDWSSCLNSSQKGTHMKIPICICWTSDWLYQKLTCINSLRYDWFPLLEERYANWVDLHSNLLSETFCINEGALNWLTKREFQHYMYWYKTLPPYPGRYKTCIYSWFIVLIIGHMQTVEEKMHVYSVNTIYVD